MLFCSTPDCTWNMLLWHSSCLAWPAVLTPNKLPSPFLLFVFQGVFPCMEYSIESVTLATAAFLVWTINCNLTLTLTIAEKAKVQRCSGRYII